jgi:hypothetical protein
MIYNIAGVRYTYFIVCVINELYIILLFNDLTGIKIEEI